MPLPPNPVRPAGARLPSTSSPRPPFPNQRFSDLRLSSSLCCQFLCWRRWCGNRPNQPKSFLLCKQSPPRVALKLVLALFKDCSIFLGDRADAANNKDKQQRMDVLGNETCSSVDTAKLNVTPWSVPQLAPRWLPAVRRRDLRRPRMVEPPQTL